MIYTRFQTHFYRQELCIRNRAMTSNLYKVNFLPSDTLTKRHIFYFDAEKSTLYEPRRQITGLRGFRPGPTQTGLDNH